MKKTLLATAAFSLALIASANADTSCVVNSPDGELNVRDVTSNGPGRVNDKLQNGYVITIRDFYLLKGKSWARVLDGKTKSRIVGWVFKDYLDCDGEASHRAAAPAPQRYASVYPYICKTTDERGNTQMYTAKLDLGRNTITWRGKVFSNLEQMDGCKAAYRATSRDGSTAELCTATQGVADLVVTGDDGSDEFECNIIH